MTKALKEIVSELKTVGKETDKQRWALEKIIENTTCDRVIKLKQVQFIKGFGYDQTKEKASMLKNEGHCSCARCLAEWALRSDASWVTQQDAKKNLSTSK